MRSSHSKMHRWLATGFVSSPKPRVSWTASSALRPHSDKTMRICMRSVSSPAVGVPKTASKPSAATFLASLRTRKLHEAHNGQIGASGMLTTDWDAALVEEPIVPTMREPAHAEKETDLFDFEDEAVKVTRSATTRVSGESHTPTDLQAEPDVNAVLLEENTSMWLSSSLNTEARSAARETASSSGHADVEDQESEADALRDAEEEEMTAMNMAREGQEKAATEADEDDDDENGATSDESLDETDETEEINRVMRALIEARKHRQHVSGSSESSADFTFFSLRELEELLAEEQSMTNTRDGTAAAESSSSSNSRDVSKAFDTSATLSAEMDSFGADLASPARP